MVPLNSLLAHSNSLHALRPRPHLAHAHHALPQQFFHPRVALALRGQAHADAPLVHAVQLPLRVVVYYCRTYEKAVSGGRERQKGGHVLRDTTSRGLCVRVWPLHTIERRGEGVVSKEVGEEERGARGGVDNATSVDVEIAGPS